MEGIGMKRPRFMISGERSGVGKSTITIGIIAALRARGLEVQPFKTGPDFLDPMHHNEVSTRRSRNLDTWMCPEWYPVSFQRASKGADVNVVEGVMGFYDGLDGRSEEGSSSHLAKRLGCPTVIVLDASSSSRSVGAVAKGFKTFDTETDVRGVIFNQVGGRKHLDMVEQAIEGLGLVSLGGIPKNEDIVLESRHLGLVPAKEKDNLDKYEGIRQTVEEHLDLDLLLEIANDAPEWREVPEPRLERRGEFKLGVAQDEAFNFYYEDNFDIMRELGAEIVPFSPVGGELPDADGYYFGGGYPELHLKELESNTGMREDLLRKVERGAPIYAECGGMMYMCRSVRSGDERHDMVGAFPSDVEMTRKLQAIGYVEAECIKDSVLSPAGGKIRGHVFHYSHVVEGKEGPFAYHLGKQKGIAGELDGFVRKNTLASYTHLHLGSNLQFAKNLADACLNERKGR